MREAGMLRRNIVARLYDLADDELSDGLFHLDDNTVAHLDSSQKELSIAPSGLILVRPPRSLTLDLPQISTHWAPSESCSSCAKLAQEKKSVIAIQTHELEVSFHVLDSSHERAKRTSAG
jgi:hypothetical protein